MRRGKEWLRSDIEAETDNMPDHAGDSLSVTEKKIFDAAFIGVIVGAGLTALLFIFL